MSNVRGANVKPTRALQLQPLAGARSLQEGTRRLRISIRLAHVVPTPTAALLLELDGLDSYAAVHAFTHVVDCECRHGNRRESLHLDPRLGGHLDCSCDS